MRYDLVGEPWIPVIHDGCRGHRSLVDTLTDAASLQDIAPDVATQSPALLRQVLLPVVLDALGPVTSDREWIALFGQGEFSTAQKNRLDNYLDRHRDRFDLFHPERPFGQTAKLRSVHGDTKSAALLVPLEATGNNVPLFSSHTDSHAMALRPADAALWLVHTHCWDTAGIKSGALGDPAVRSGKTTGNPTGPLGNLGVFLLKGRSLFETIVLNLPIEPEGRPAADVPPWRRPSATARWTTRQAAGLLDLLTWQSRRVRLFADGDRQVRRVIVAAGDRLTSVPDFEPHTLWRSHHDDASDSWVRYPARTVVGRHVWRDARVLFPGAEDPSRLLRQAAALRGVSAIDSAYPLRVETFGMEYGAQSSIVQDYVADHLPIPVDALVPGAVRESLLTVVAQSDQLARAAQRFAAEVRSAQGDRAGHADTHAGDALIDALDPLIRRLFAGLQHGGGEQAIEGGMRAWAVMARRIVAESARTQGAGLPAAQQRFTERVDEILANAAAKSEIEVSG